MYPLSLRVGDRGGPNPQPPIPSLCLPTASLQLIVAFPHPPPPRCLPLPTLLEISPHALSSSSSSPHPTVPGYQIVRKKKYYFTHPPKTSTLFLKSVLYRKNLYKPFMIIFLIRQTDCKISSRVPSGCALKSMVKHSSID